MRLLGVDLTPLTCEEILALLERTIAAGERRILANHNLHSIYLFHHDAGMRDFYAAADYAYIDGMPIVALARLLGHKLHRGHRVTTIDWLIPLLERANRRNWRVFYLGAEPGVAEKAAAILRGRVPGVQIKTAHGYFNRESSENLRVLEQINSYKPHVLMVGMSMPIQEKWIKSNLQKIDANAIMNVGATFRLVAGVIPTPPRWTGRLGIEGLYRLIIDPRRLWRRYLLEPVLLLFLLLQRSLFERSEARTEREARV